MRRARGLLMLIVLIGVTAPLIGAAGCKPQAALDPGTPAVVETEPSAGDFMGWHGRMGVYLCWEWSSQWVELRGDETVRLYYFSVGVLPDGSLVLSDRAKGMVLRDPSGQETVLLDPYEVTWGIVTSSDGRYVAYGYPLEWDGDEPTRSGIAIYDLVERASRVLLVDDSYMPSICGWLGERIVFMKYDRERLHTVDLEGREERLCTLPEDFFTAFNALRDGMLPYLTRSREVRVLNIRTGAVIPLPGAAEPRWTEKGLEVLVEGKRRILLELPYRGGN